MPHDRSAFLDGSIGVPAVSIYVRRRGAGYSPQRVQGAVCSRVGVRAHAALPRRAPLRLSGESRNPRRLSGVWVNGLQLPQELPVAGCDLPSLRVVGGVVSGFRRNDGRRGGMAGGGRLVLNCDSFDLSDFWVGLVAVRAWEGDSGGVAGLRAGGVGGSKLRVLRFPWRVRRLTPSGIIRRTSIRVGVWVWLPRFGSFL